MNLHSCLSILFPLLVIQMASASVFLPHSAVVTDSSLRLQQPSWSSRMSQTQRTKLRLNAQRTKNSGGATAMAIPGYGIAEQVVVGGFANFLSLYNLIITARVLLSWIPQAQGVAVLQPIFAVTDPYLNLFRGLIPPVFGLDLSPLLAFFLLNVMTNVTAAVGAEIPVQDLPMMNQRRGMFGKTRSTLNKLLQPQQPCETKAQLSLDL
ncbi:hypothetical protein MPSEU_000314200 [Mayamaea pseudoterrestris]|nr:hypothetical protein MPSEU_000314200 [Mayamaea pseudoterrestris]